MLRTVFPPPPCWWSPHGAPPVQSAPHGTPQCRRALRLVFSSWRPGRTTTRGTLADVYGQQGPRWHRPGGVTNGPNQQHSPRHVLRFGPSEGLRVGHTVHRGRQETRLSRKDSPATQSVPDPGVATGWSTWLWSRSICTERVQMDGPYNRVTP